VGFAKAYHKIPPRRKSGRGHRLGQLPKILGFPFNISALKLASLNLACRWGLSGPIIQIPPNRTQIPAKKWAWRLARGDPLKFAMAEVAMAFLRNDIK